MADLKTSYMGLELKNPIIIGSSGLTDTVEKVVELEKAGAAAVVLKSLFEEQILKTYHERLEEFRVESAYPEAEEYIISHTRQQAVEEYLELIRNCRKAVSIPVIASINCLSVSEWINFAKDIQEAGASALELNLFVLPSDPQRNAEQNEESYLFILMEVVKRVNIPVAAKISPYFTAMTNTAMKFSWTGIKGMVLFNRYYASDIDIESLELVPGNVFSTPADIYLPLRWTAILHDRVNCDLAATGGAHDGAAVVKLLLAGATAVQIASVLYEKGSSHVGKMLREVENYMDMKGYKTLPELIGKMSMHAIENPAAYERVQFMKHFSSVE